MAQAAAPESHASFWTQRLYDAVPLAPASVGVLLALAMFALFFAIETAVGRTPIVLEAQPLSHSGEAFITLLLSALLAYLCTATISALRAGPLAVRRVRHLLEGSNAELDALEEAAADRPRRTLMIMGLCGVLVAALTPLLEVPRFNPYDWSQLSGPSVWHRILAPCIGWWMGRLIGIMLMDSRRHSRLANRIASIDLLDLKPLVSFARLGLSNALRVVGIVAIFAPLLIDAARYAPLFLSAALLTLTSATLALVLPVRGVHRRIRTTKESELDRVNRAIHGEPDALSGSAVGRREPPPSLADLVAYRGLVESSREWPFDASTVLRFALYLTIPLGSWLGGAVVERWVDAVLG